MKKTLWFVLVLLGCSAGLSEEQTLGQAFEARTGKRATHPAVLNYTRNRLMNTMSSFCMISTNSIDAMWSVLLGDLKDSEAKGEIIITEVDRRNGLMTFDQPAALGSLTTRYFITADPGRSVHFKIDISIPRSVILTDLNALIVFAEIMDMAKNADSRLGALKTFADKSETRPFKIVCPKGMTDDCRHGTPVLRYYVSQRIVDVQPEGRVSKAKYDSTRKMVHAGIDILAKPGDKIYPVEDGTVIDLIDNPNDKNWRVLGYLVILEHLDKNNRKWWSLYSSMGSKPFVMPGERVEKGETMLGVVGDSGEEPGKTHVHLELRRFESRFFKNWESLLGILDPGSYQACKAGDLETGWIDPAGPLFQAVEASVARPAAVVVKPDTPVKPPAPPVEEKPVAVAAKPLPPEIRCFIFASIQDDPAKGEAISGNADGIAQNGEAFDLVVVVKNDGAQTAKNVTCAVTLPAEKTLRAFSDLAFPVPALAPDAAFTNRITIAVPLSAKIETSPVCVIEVRESGSNVVRRLDFNVPVAKH
jgi:hypothetical protein